jgi:hypothetical protein
VQMGEEQLMMMRMMVGRKVVEGSHEHIGHMQSLFVIDSSVSEHAENPNAY